MNTDQFFFGPDSKDWTPAQIKATLGEMVSKTYVEYSYTENGKDQNIRFGHGSKFTLQAAETWEFEARMNPAIRWLRKSQTTFQQLKA